MIDTSSNVTCLSTSPNTDGPSIKVTFNGQTLVLGRASDRLIDCFIWELTDCLSEMSDRRQRHGTWETYEYERSQTYYHLRGLMQERSRRLDLVLRSQPALVEVGA